MHAYYSGKSKLDADNRSKYEFYSLKYSTLFRNHCPNIESFKEARRLFRLFKSINEYRDLIKILLYDALK